MYDVNIVVNHSEISDTLHHRWLTYDWATLELLEEIKPSISIESMYALQELKGIALSHQKLFKEKQ